MQILVKGFGTTDAEKAQVWLADGMFRRRIPSDWIGGGSGPITNAQVHQAGILGNLSWSGNVFTSGGDPTVWGVDVESLGDAGVISDEQLPAVGAAVAADLREALEDAAFEGAQRAERE